METAELKARKARLPIKKRDTKDEGEWGKTTLCEWGKPTLLSIFRAGVQMIRERPARPSRAQQADGRHAGTVQPAA